MAKVILHKDEVFERVFLNEPSLDLHIVQEAGSRVKIHLLNMSVSTSPSSIPSMPSMSSLPSMPSPIRNSITVEQVGEGCRTEIYALAYLHGGENVTTETHVHHRVGGGTSDQLVKFVLDDHARGHFIGDLKIAPDAQQVEAHQTNRNLLLSDDAEMRTQPQLEIYADDVQATHGASTGQLDEAALFYMQQRGIGRQKARQLLVSAFMKDVIETISDEKIKADCLTVTAPD